MPIVVGVAADRAAVALAVDVCRGGRGEAEGGEDVDLGQPDRLARRCCLLARRFVANVVLIEPLGWVISGALLFCGSAFALGSRHYVRDLVIALALSLGTFYVFAIGLGVNLPAGILQGIL